MNGKEIERLASLETTTDVLVDDVKEVKGDIKDILTNHLPHIKQEIQSNKLKIAAITGAAAFVGSKVADIILK